MDSNKKSVYNENKRKNVLMFQKITTVYGVRPHLVSRKVGRHQNMFLYTASDMNCFLAEKIKKRGAAVRSVRGPRVFCVRVSRYTV